MTTTVLMLVVLATGALSSQPMYDYYDPRWDTQLYERLSRLAGDQHLAGDQLQYDYEAPEWAEGIAREERESAGAADIRDHESLEHSATGDGFQYISGQAARPLRGPLTRPLSGPLLQLVRT